MAKPRKQEWVSEDFASYLTKVQKKVEEDTGNKISRQDITAILAVQQPVIKIEVKKKGSLFDF